MRRGKIELATVFTLFTVIIFMPSGLTPNPSVSAAPNSPYEGIGGLLDVYEFARKDSSMTYRNGVEDTTFTYLGSWFPQTPTIYRGYQLQAEVTNLFEIRDPVPNGEFNQTEPGTAWEQERNERAIVHDWGTTSFEGNPPDCLYIHLDYRFEDDAAEARYENTFTYTSDKQPYNSTLEFDIKYHPFITQKKELQVRVALNYHGTEIGSWSETTDVYSPAFWDHLSFSSAPINGSVTLSISIIYSGGKNNLLQGYIYFDNFRYRILTQRSPSEVGLTLNNTTFIDTGSNKGTVKVYADPANRTEAPPTNCWNSDQLFQFNSSKEISFHYDYSMYVKTKKDGAATTSFSAPVNGQPTWQVSYLTPTPLPPPNHDGYSFGLNLEEGWSNPIVKNSSHTLSLPSHYSYNTSSHFVKLVDGVPTANEAFTIIVSSTNQVLQIVIQQKTSPTEPWTNFTHEHYFIKDDFIRILAKFSTIHLTDNTANVSLFRPDGSLWQSDTTPQFFPQNNSLKTTTWQIPSIDEIDAGSDWLVTVSFNTSYQCGMREENFAVFINTKGTKISPSDGQKIIWGDKTLVKVSWQNNDTSAYIGTGTAQLTYVDRNFQSQYTTMTSHHNGSYSWDFDTSQLRPSLTAKFSVELTQDGYVTSHLNFSINLVNPIEEVLIKPAQKVGDHEYLGETSKTLGYTCQVKFYDPYQASYVSYNSTPWTTDFESPMPIVTYTRYEDYTGSGPWVEVVDPPGTFTPNASNPTLFEKFDISYGDAIFRVKYDVTLRIEGASWEYRSQNFTIIISVVSWATNLDAVRTDIDYPPTGTGNGWTEYNNLTDSYEVHIYWDNWFNITVYYENIDTLTGIESATVKILIGGTVYSLDEKTDGYYNYSLNTASLPVGTHALFVNATYTDHALQTIRINLIIEARKTQLVADYTPTALELVYNDNAIITFTFNDISGSQEVGISNAGITVSGFAENWEYNPLTPGVYTITLNGTISEGFYTVIIRFNKTNYQTQTKLYEVTVRPAHTTSSGNAESPSVAWGDNVTIILKYYDTDHSSYGIPGATIGFSWMDGHEGQDYWEMDYDNGTYTITLNTTLVPQGTQGYTLTFTFNKTHYDINQVNVVFQVRDIQTSLSILDTIVMGSTSTSVPWGESLTLILKFNDDDHNVIISGASIWCDWEIFYWDSIYDAASGYYNLTIYTENEVEGGFLVQITATNEHYMTDYNLQSFVIRQIRTGLEANTPAQIVEIGTNATCLFTYSDLDHLGVSIKNATVTIDWLFGYYSISDFGNGTYFLQLNTSISSVGTHTIQVEFAYPHYDSKTIFITVEITRIQLNMQIIEPATGRWEVEYNELVNISLLVTNLAGVPINDAIVEYSWAGRGFVAMNWQGSGHYYVEFYANASVGPDYQVTLRASNTTKYFSITKIIIITINPTATRLEILSPIEFSVFFGDSFNLTVSFVTDRDNVPINGANVSYNFRLLNGTEIDAGYLFDAGSGIYTRILNTTALVEFYYQIYVSASKPTMGQDVREFRLTLEEIPTEIVPLQEPIQVLVGTNFTISVMLNDTHNSLLISNADLTITIVALGIEEPMINHHNGTYTFEWYSGLLETTHTIQITASAPFPYKTPSSRTIYIYVRATDFTRSIMVYVSIGAVIAILGLILWVAYVRVFSIPWMVRKMRKMAKSIGKGGSPSLSKMERARISDRTGLISEIAASYYSSVGLAAAPTVIPAEINWAEREAEDDAIWSKLKSLPFIEYEQKLDLFQQMKQIAPAERVWFIEDLRRQMADGTRFDRKVKEPEISEDLETELQARLATYPTLGKLEKERIAAQLRKIPKEDWEEIFQTLAIADKPQAETVEEVLGPAEFPSLTEKERQKLLEELKDLSDEERQKVLQTFREKRSKDIPKGKIVKDKKEFIIDDSDDK